MMLNPFHIDFCNFLRNAELSQKLDEQLMALLTEFRSAFAFWSKRNRLVRPNDYVSVALQAPQRPNGRDMRDTEVVGYFAGSCFALCTNQIRYQLGVIFGSLTRMMPTGDFE